MVEVETAKAAVEVPCPYAGRVVTLHGAVGDVLAVGQPLITVALPTHRSTRPVDAARRTPRAAGGSGRCAGGLRERSLVGYGTDAAVGPPTADVGSTARRAVARPAAAHQRCRADAVISPIVRKLARDGGLDLARAGRVRARPARPPPRRRGRARRCPESDACAPRARERRGRCASRCAACAASVADKLSRSRREIPDATTWVDVDATGLLEARDALRGADPDRPVGLLALLARISVAGAAAVSRAQRPRRHRRGEIVRLPHVNLGFAAQTDRGLVVPVVRDAHR